MTQADEFAQGKAPMTPGKFVAHQERRLERPLTIAEVLAVESARGQCHTGKRDTVKAMWDALKLSRA